MGRQAFAHLQATDTAIDGAPARAKAPHVAAGGPAGLLGHQPASLNHGTLLALQRFAGNGAVGELLGRGSGAGPAALPAWRAGSQLWYFDGEPGNGTLPTSSTLSVQPVAEGTLDWSVVDGADKVELAPEGGDTQIRVRSLQGSSGEDDVRIRVAHTAADGSVAGVYEGNLGVRTPVGVRRVSGSTTPASVGAPAPSTFPVAGEDVDQGGGVTDQTTDQSSGGGDQQTDDQPPNSGPVPETVPKSLNHQSTWHQQHATFGYESRESYEVLDDAGSPIRGFDVNEKFTSITNDDPACDWRHTEGGAHATGTTFADVMQGETAGHHPAPMAPQNPLGTHKVQAMAQEWRIGNTTPGKGTLVQRNILQRWQDHATHENIKSPP